MTKRNGNKKSEYELFKEQFKKSISEYETELIDLLKSTSTTYLDIDKEVKMIKQDAVWYNDKILLGVIKSVERKFENEKGSLLLK
jgi:hypothetical protein